MGEPGLLEIELVAVQLVYLLADPRLGLDDLELQIGVLELEERLAFRNHRAFLDIDLGDLAALDRIEIDGLARHDIACHGYVFAEGAVFDL